MVLRATSWRDASSCSLETRESEAVQSRSSSVYGSAGSISKMSALRFAAILVATLLVWF